ncbi:glycosyltransferase family 2 protein [Legionella geestiana]|nr:glycosyltransferase family 2 protein [Legionella geestiana]
MVHDRHGGRVPVLQHLSIAAPAYNEAEGLAEVLLAWVEYLRNYSGLLSFEIVVCNDGSSDGTGELLDALAAENPEIRPIHLPHNEGAGAALAQAILHTQKDWVLLMDTDGQFPVENLERLAKTLQTARVQAVIGVRCKKDNALARFGSAASSRICNRLHGTRLRDFNSACKLVQGNLLRALRLEARGMNYSTEITARLIECGAPLAEVDIEHRAREYGRSHLRFMRDSVHRALFTAYLALRLLLINRNILRVSYEKTARVAKE